MSVNGRIWPGELANAIKYQIDEALRNNINEAELYINSEGGSVFEAQEVVNELKRIGKVNIKVGALAASAATFILCHFPASCFKGSQFMIHKPHTQLSGNEDEVRSDLKALENVTKVYRDAYCKRFNKTAEEIEAMWKNDYWMDAEEARQLKLVDNVIDEALQIDDSTVKMMAACGCPNVPKINNTKNTNMSILETLSSVLDTESNENAIVKEVKNLKKDKEEWKQKYEALISAEAKKIVQKAVSLNLIPKELEEGQTQLITQDFEAQSEKLNKLIANKEEALGQHQRQNVIAGAVSLSAKTGAAPSNEKETYDYLQKHNAVELSRIRTEEPEKYAALAKEYAQGVRYHGGK